MYSIMMTAALVSLSPGQAANDNQMVGHFALHADTKMNFNDANQFCHDKYGYGLATIGNASDAETVLGMVQAANCGTGAPGTRNTWVGLVDHGSSGWYWTTGDKCDGDCNDFWRNGRPVDDPDRACGVIWHKATEWDNMMGNGWCDRKLCFVCAVDKEGFVAGNAVFADAFEGQQHDWNLELTVKDLVIMGLCIVNVIALIALVVYSRRGFKGRAVFIK